MACTTGQDGINEATCFLAILEAQLDKYPWHHDLVVPLMAIHHRTGQFKEVVRLAGREKLIYAGAVGQPRVSHWVKGLRVLAFAHLAMTYQSLGNKKQARQTLTSAEDLQQEIIAIRESGNFRKSDLPPERFLEAELLLAEARDMVDEHE